MSLKKNILANYLGQSWVALMGIVFIPLYVKYLGIEAYGLIGVFAILQACLTLLDLGMTPTLNREMARYTAGAHTLQAINDLLRSLEVICFSMALIIAGVIFFSSEWLASDWLRAENLPVKKVSYSLCVMGVVVSLRFVESLYRSAILGLQKQVLFNIVNCSMATLRSVGVLAVIIWFSPTIEAFFLWQSVVSIISIVILKVLVHKLIPRPAKKPSFSTKSIAGVWRFAGSMLATSFLSLLLLQTDKVLLSRLLPLDSFGYYTFAASVSGALYLLAVPIAQSFSPRLTELVTLGDSKVLIYSYHQAAQLVTAMVMPIAMILILFAEPLILIWTNNIILASKVSPIIQVLTLGSALNALMYPPYMMQLGYGWGSFSVKVNFMAVIILVPTLILITPHYGVIGAAWAWVVLNILYVVIATHFMHKHILKNEKWVWYVYDVLLPSLGSASIVVISWMAHPAETSRIIDFIWILLTSITALFGSLFASNLLRQYIFKLVIAIRI